MSFADFWQNGITFPIMNPAVLNTEHKPDYTKNYIKLQSCDRPPLESPISQSTQLLNLFIQATGMKIDNRPFPLQVVDSRIASRLKKILNEYIVLNKNVSHWLSTIENRIGRQYIEEEYVVGSSVGFIAGQPILRIALDIYIEDIPNNLQLFAKLVGKINQKTFSFADVDLRIKVSQGCNLQEVQNSLGNFRSDLFYGKILIIYIGEKNENTLDIVVYKELDTDSAFNIDDFKVNLRKSDLSNNHVVFESTNPWKWWMGHVLGYLEDYTKDSFRSFFRLLWQESKGKISILKAESAIFPSWVATINTKLKTNREALKLQFEKHQANHDSKVPIADCLNRLKIQQLIRDQSPKSKGILKETTSALIDPSVPAFIKAIFQVMNTKGSDIFAVHGLIECIAKLAIYEAWKKPFEVKLVVHEGVWVQRIRFRGVFGKRDLLVRFDVDAASTFLQKTTLETWEKMRVIVHSLFFEDLSQRELSKSYKNVNVSSELALEIKRKLLPFSNTATVQGVFAKIPLLAELEISTNEEARILLEIGKLVFHHYRHDPVKRSQLCWKAVEKCIKLNGFSYAAELVKLLRGEGEEPIEGYAALFAEILLKDGNSYYLYQACSPIPNVSEDQWFKLSQSKTKVNAFITLMNDLDVSAEIFLKIVRLLNVKKPPLSESMLCKIIVHDKNRAPQWILAKGKANFASDDYKRLVSQEIFENKGSFTPQWIKDFIISERLVGSESEKLNLCKYLLSKSIETDDKVRVVQLFGIKDKECWKVVANDYISQVDEWSQISKNNVNFDYESLVKWFQIVMNCDNDVVVSTKLKEINDHSFKGIALVRILKNWKTKQANLGTLKALDPTKKIPWEILIAKAESGKDILKGLLDVSLNLYSALYAAIRPKEEFYAAFWVKMIQGEYPEEKTPNLVKDIQKSFMTDCLLIRPDVTSPIIKRIAGTGEGTIFILENVNELDVETLSTMLNTCLKLEDAKLCSTVFMKYYDSSIHKKPALYPCFATVAKKVLLDPKANSAAAEKIWDIIHGQANPEQLPSNEQLLKLIKSGYFDWVIDLLNNSTPEERQLVDLEIYSLLLESVKDLDKRCEILEGCLLSSSSIQKHWVLIAQAENLDVFNAAKLLKSAKKLSIADHKIQQCALRCLSSTAIIDDDILKELLEMVPRLDDDNAYRLWEVLQKSNRYKKSDLWAAGFTILKRNHLHYHLLAWLAKNAKGNNVELLLAFLDELPDYSRIESIIHPLIKKESGKDNAIANKILWKIDSEEFILGKHLRATNENKTQHVVEHYFNQLFLYATDAQIQKIPIWIVQCLVSYKDQMAVFHKLLERLEDPIQKKLINGILSTSMMIRYPSKEVAESYIENLGFIWDPSVTHLKYGRYLNLSLDEFYEAGIGDITCSRAILWDCLKVVFMNAKEVFNEPDIFAKLIDLVSLCDKDHFQEQYYLIMLLINMLNEKFNRQNGDMLLDFILKKNPIYHAENVVLERFFNTLAAFMVVNYPDRKQIAIDLGEFMQVFIIGNSYITSKHIGLLGSYIAVIGSLNGLQRCQPQVMTLAIEKAILILCQSRQSENHICARNLLRVSTPELLIFYPEILVRCTEMYTKCIVSHYDGSELIDRIPHLFMNLSDKEMFRTCFDMPEKDLQEYIKTWGPSKTTNGSAFIKGLKRFQLNLINSSIQNILDIKPSIIIPLIDFLNSKVILELSDNYKALPEYYKELFVIILMSWKKIQSFDEALNVMNKLNGLICCHAHLSKENILSILTDNSIKIPTITQEIHDLCKLEANPTALLDFKYPEYNHIAEEFLMRNQWCLLTTNLAPTLNHNDTKKWLMNIRLQFCRSFYLASLLPDMKAPTLNLLETLGKTMQISQKMSLEESEFLNEWIYSFILGLKSCLFQERTWFAHFIVDKMGSILNEHLLPSLIHLEDLHDCCSINHPQVNMINIYYSLVEKGLFNTQILNKALLHCHSLQTLPRVKSQLMNGTTYVCVEFIEPAFNFRGRFEFLFLMAFKDLFNRYGKASDENFLLQLDFIINATKSTLPLLDGMNRLIPREWIELIYLNLPYFPTNVRFEPIIKLMFTTMNKLVGKFYFQGNSDIAKYDYHAILFAIFKGDNLPIDSIHCFAILRHRFETEIAHFDMSISIKKTNFCHDILLWTILEDPQSPSPFYQSVMQLALNNPAFKESYTKELLLAKNMIQNFKKIRPDSTDWYQDWIMVINRIRESLED